MTQTLLKAAVLHVVVNAHGLADMQIERVCLDLANRLGNVIRLLLINVTSDFNIFNIRAFPGDFAKNVVLKGNVEYFLFCPEKLQKKPEKLNMLNMLNLEELIRPGLTHRMHHDSTYLTFTGFLGIFKENWQFYWEMLNMSSVPVKNVIKKP